MARVLLASLVALTLALPVWANPTPISGPAVPIEETVGETTFGGQWG